jgi:exodeoxyribonuclease VII small subunit
VSFESDVARLEAIAAELDGSGGQGVTLDRALELFEEGVACLRRASSELTRAESRVTQLVEQIDGTFTLKPFRNE